MTGDCSFNYGMLPIVLVFLFSTETMEIIKIHLGHLIRWLSTALDTKFTHNVCAGIGPLQLGASCACCFFLFDIIYFVSLSFVHDTLKHLRINRIMKICTIFVKKKSTFLHLFLFFKLLIFIGPYG